MEGVSRADQETPLLCVNKPSTEALFSPEAVRSIGSYSTAIGMSVQQGLDAAEWVVKSFRPVKPTTQWIAALLASLTTLAPEIQHGPTIGRKRRARRTRGRTRRINHTNRSRK